MKKSVKKFLKKQQKNKEKADQIKNLLGRNLLGSAVHVYNVLVKGTNYENTGLAFAKQFSKIQTLKAKLHSDICKAVNDYNFIIGNLSKKI